MKHLKKSYLARYIILMSSLLIINVVLGVLLGLQSSSSLKEQINSRMMDISRTAAAMINGDDLRDIRGEDKGTPKYENIMSILNYFRNYTELQYIYCVKKTDNGPFVFILDTDPDDPGEYGDPIIYTDALNEANNGKTTVDDDAYEDQWGTFYSAYCPVFDSNGRVGGIIAVDYSKEWYDKQMVAQIRTTIIVIGTSFMIGTIMIVVMSKIAGKRRKINEHLSKQLSSTADIYIAMHEIDFVTNTINEVRNDGTDVSAMLGGRNTDCQQVISRMMDALTDSASHDKMLDFVDFSKLDMRLREHNTMTADFLNSEGKWCKARFIVSGRLPDGSVSNAMFLIEDIDEEKRCRDMVFDTAQQLSHQLRSIADIYTAVYDVDIINDSFVEISANDMFVVNSVGNDVNNAQKTLKSAMTKLTNDLFKEDVLKFVEYSNIEKNVAQSGIATIEFLNSRDKWSRGRFIVSERTEDGRISHVIWAVENIDTERKERDKLRDISERALAASEAKSSFLSNMSHEIRTPINAVLGMNEMILRESNDKNIIEYSESIKTAGSTLLGLINDILDFSKIEAGKLEIIPVEYDLSIVINDLVNMIQPKVDNKGLELVLDINDTIPKNLFGDEVRIKQIITNILTNAVKYTEEGTVTFGMQYKKMPGDPNSIILTVSVKDTGIGIKEEEISKLFSKFDRIEEKRNRHIEGTGLGMSITQCLLEMMGSTLEVDSTYGVGSTFSFNLKQKVMKWESINDYEQAYKEKLEKREKYHHKFTAPDAWVLVVDDILVNLKVFKNLLKNTEVNIDMTQSGEEGLDLMRRRRYDIIFLDHMMPEKDGIEVLNELMAHENPNTDTAKVCLTANAVSGAKQKYIDAGFDDYLSKPIDPQKLEEMLIQYIPENKVVYSVAEVSEEKILPEDDTVIPEFIYGITEINPQFGIRNCGGRGSFVQTLNTFSKSIDGYLRDIQKSYNANDIRNTTSKIHAFKSLLKIVGAAILGEMAQELENAGNENDILKLEFNISPFLSRCKLLSKRLEPLKEQEEEDNIGLPSLSDEKYKEACMKMKYLAEECDSLGILDEIDELKKYNWDREQSEKIKSIQKAVDELEYEEIAELLDEFDSI